MLLGLVPDQPLFHVLADRGWTVRRLVRGDENAFSSKRSALTRYYLPCRAPSLSARLKAFYLVMGQYDGVVIPSSEAA